MKRLPLLIGIVLVLAMLAACTVPATPVPPAAATGDQASAAASDVPGWCSDTKIVFFPGGPAGGVFANNVYNGAKQAQADLGADVQYVFSDWDPQKMIQQFQEAAATKPDGIAVMGHPGDDAFSPLIDKAEADGIIVTSQNTELPTSFDKYQGNGFGYVGAVNYTAGFNLGKEAVKRFALAVRRPRHGLGPAVAALTRRANQGRHRRAGRSRPDGGLSGDRRCHQR